MRIGLDLDNTLAGYDAIFESLARERGVSLPAGSTKKNIRDAVRVSAGNDVWTEFQGLAYGPRMKDARLLPGADAFLAWVRGNGIQVWVVSHKTPRSAVGGHDLHGPATDWLASHGFTVGKDAFLEPTREDKLARIARLGATHFVDDLEEFLSDPHFPSGVERLHYAPEGVPAVASGRSAPFRSFGGWQELLEYFKRNHR